jgi:hypothetical protein
VNPKGNSENLSAAHPGNTNAVKSGVHSPRLIQERADQIVQNSTFSVELDALGQLALNEVARISATIEAIERDLDERGLTDKSGDERYLLRRRDSMARRFGEAHDRLVTAVERAEKRDNTANRTSVPPEPLAQLRALASATHPEGGMPEQMAALKLWLDRARRFGG